MARHDLRGLHIVFVFGFGVAAMACQEGITFTPSDPASVRERILTELKASNNLRTQLIAAGVTAEVERLGGGNTNEIGELLRFLMDWTSDANHLTITVYQTSLISRNGFETTCRVPGARVTSPPSLPLCAVVASVTTHEKPKVLQQSGDRGELSGFSFVVTNNGPGNETIRWALDDIGRHTRL